MASGKVIGEIIGLLILTAMIPTLAVTLAETVGNFTGFGLVMITLASSLVALIPLYYVLKMVGIKIG